MCPEEYIKPSYYSFYSFINLCVFTLGEALS
jgi:hypothetical protein